jgi:hypothetical protein
MAIKQPARKRLYRTMQGRTVDIDKLRAQNEDIPAVGNMNVNARGDMLGAGGKIIKPKQSVMREYYQTPKGVAQDTPVKKTPMEKRQPIPQLKVEQVQTIDPTVFEKKPAPRKIVKTAPKTESTNSGIDAALDGIE